tara:strand:+ start:1191 stop:2123 length:933 start_codon:yes stop_codon:yes gene_type:complete
MINLFNINNYKIDTSSYTSFLSDERVQKLENQIADFVGAKYACAMCSATMAIFLCLTEEESQTIEIPAIIPPVVPNAILCAKHSVVYRDDIDWVGSSYILHEFPDYKIIDSAQQLEKNQFKKQANDEDLMIFSFYPTKPVGSIDGGMIVSNDYEKIQKLKILSRYGMTDNKNSWERKILLPGWKMYMNSMQADIAMRNLAKLENKIDKLNLVRQKYNSQFGLSNDSHHLYRIRVSNRESFIENMKKSDIQCGIHYKAVHNIDCYKTDKSVVLEKTEIEEKQTVSIPYHEKLTKKQIELVVEKVKKYANFG